MFSILEIDILEDNNPFTRPIIRCAGNATLKIFYGDFFSVLFDALKGYKFSFSFSKSCEKKSLKLKDDDGLEMTNLRPDH